MRGFSLAVLMVLAVAAVLVFSVRSLRKERGRLLQEFAAREEATAHELVSDLEDRLRDLEEDSRVIGTLVKETHDASDVDRDESDRTLLDSFKAMATVVRHYRSLALFGPAHAVRLSAVDPTETATLADRLMALSARTAALPAGVRQLSGPIELVPGRPFYVYRFRVGAETVVITIDGARFLQSAVRSVPGARVVVTDPQGAEWAGCSPATPCAPGFEKGGSAEEATWTDPSGAAWLTGALGRRFGVRDGEAVAAWASTESAALGKWRLLVVASAAALHGREQTLARQLLFTAAGLLLSIGVLGALIVRQQRYSAALAERLRSAEALQLLERQLIRAEKLATTGVLAAGIAHEVGTPLGIIRARAELLMDELARPEEQRALDAIVQQIDRISSTIRQVLDFSRAQSVEVDSVDAATALRSTLELLEYRFRQQQLSVDVQIDPGLPAMAADPNQFQQVMINILMNACDASQSGKAIHIRARLRDGRADDSRPAIRWEIRDEGEGIAAENLLAVFDPFFTTKKHGEGTGLGLPVAASIVRNHGGEISLASIAGEGTTVTILWPIAERGAAHAQG